MTEITPTLLYWLCLAAITFIAFKKMYELGWNNVCGYQKVSGVWTKTMYPDHYFFHMTLFCYIAGAAAISICVYLISAFVLYYFKWDAMYGITTGMSAIISGLK